MQKFYKIVLATLLIALLFAQNKLQAQKCCVECQTDVKVISDKQVLLEKIDIKEGTSLTNVNTNVYVSYRSGNTQKFWANLAIATAGVVISTQLSNGNAGEGKTQNAISPIVPLGVSVAILPSIWKNRPRSVPQAGLYIQYRDTRGKLLETWEQPISSEAKNSAELLTIFVDKPLSAGSLEVYLQNGNKNGIYFWGYSTLNNSQVVENNRTVPSNNPKPPVLNSCQSGTHDDGWGNCEIDVDVNVGQDPTPPPPPPRTNPWDNNGDNGNPNGTYDNPGGGGNSGGNEDRPETINKPFHFDMLKGDGSPVGDYVTPVVTSYERGTLYRPNARSPWKFQSFTFSNIGVNGRFFLEVWTASTLSPIENIDSDGSYASMNHTWQLTRTAAIGEILFGGAGTSHPHHNDYGYSAN